MFQGLSEDWKQLLVRDLNAQLVPVVTKLLHAADTGARITPPFDRIFEFARATPLDRVSCVLLGQDPYPRAGEACGLSFSCRTGIPLSLRAIYGNLVHSGLMREMPKTGDISHWADSGMLLLNVSLTTNVGVSQAHKDIWEQYTTHLIRAIAARGPVFMLLGSNAIAYKYVLGDAVSFEWGHPSPMNSANRTDNPRNFKYCDVFVKTAAELARRGKPPIQWEKPDVAVAPSAPSAQAAIALSPCDHAASAANTQTPSTEASANVPPQAPLAQTPTHPTDASANALPQAACAVNLPPDMSTDAQAASDPQTGETADTANTQTVAEATADAAELSVLLKTVVDRDIGASDPVPTDSGSVYIFTDGGCKSNGRRDAVASYGCYITDGKRVVINHGVVPATDLGLAYTASNQRGELTAILVGLYLAAERYSATSVKIVSDSEYSIKCISTWGPKWLRLGQLDDKKNLDLILPAIGKLRALQKNAKVEFIHIRSHRAAPTDPAAKFLWQGNDIVDKLCQYNLA
jgi:uracil-DNA glycosylase